MAKPAILIVESTAEIRQTAEQVLGHRYSDGYDVVVLDTGVRALEWLQQHQEDSLVALILTNVQLAEMTGVEFLQQSAKYSPEARRGLLVEKEEAPKRTNESVRIDAYLDRFSTMPTEQLYPVIDDLLEEWQNSSTASIPEEAKVRVIGHRWSADTHEVKDYLARNQIPVEWMDIDHSAEAQQLYHELQQEQADEQEPLRLPVVFFPDGSYVGSATEDEIADKLGKSRQPSMSFYDLIIVGGGPAGLSAAVYAASEGLRTMLVEKDVPGGQAALSARIDNYLGFPAGLSGADLARRAVLQAERFAVEIVAPQSVTHLWSKGSYRFVRLADGSEVGAQVIVLSMGVEWRTLDVPGVDRLVGSGVYYGSTMAEARACTDEHVYILGGSNSAAQAAVYFSQYASQVTMLVREDDLAEKSSQYLVDEIQATPIIHLLTNTEVAATQGEDRLEGLVLRNTETGAEEQVPASLLFVFIGATPQTGWLEGAILRDEHGYILTGSDLTKDDRWTEDWPLKRPPMMFETSMPGVFAVGDVRHGSIKRVASAVGQGGMVVQVIHEYMQTV